MKLFEFIEHLKGISRYIPNSPVVDEKFIPLTTWRILTTPKPCIQLSASSYGAPTVWDWYNALLEIPQEYLECNVVAENYKPITDTVEMPMPSVRAPGAKPKPEMTEQEYSDDFLDNYNLYMHEMQDICMISTMTEEEYEEINAEWELEDLLNNIFPEDD